MHDSQLYRLRRAEPPWGDYGDILTHGLAKRASDGVLELERTGPFIPPLSQPGRFAVATAAFAARLLASGFKGLELRPVRKKRITKVEWTNWAPIGAVEMKYPAGGEPENYVLKRKHSPDTADALGELHELKFVGIVAAGHEGGLHAVKDSWDQSDFCSLMLHGAPAYLCVSERAREWLTKETSEWVTFQKLPLR